MENKLDETFAHKTAFEKYGFGNVKIRPANLLSENSFNFVKDHLNSKFKSEKNQMNYLSMWLYTTKL